jgi:hypothetical protein
MTDEPRTFELRSCRDMMAKMERELERVRSAGSERGILTDHGINFAWTAWHMADWVWADMTGAQRHQVAVEAGADPNKFVLADFQPYVCSKSRALALCRIIATAAKHSECRFGADIDMDPDVSLGPTFFVAGVSTPQRRWVLKLDVDGDRVPATEVFEAALGYWTEFIYPRQIDRDG